MNSSSSPDPDGDVFLRCKDQDTGIPRSFRVSSKVLRLASPVFARLLGPSFQEGQKLRQEGCVVVELEDDDAPLMKLILDVLHYQADITYQDVNAEKLARLAIHCDKYDCTKALGPWVSTWFKDVAVTPGDMVELGFRLLAAYLLNDSGRFAQISKEAMEEVTSNFSMIWEEKEIATLLPSGLPSKSDNSSVNCDCD
jgi:hypothetical protein